MKLKVATKIIGGFAFMAVLLVITSVASLWNLGTIGESTKEVSKVAIPMLKQSNELSVELSAMGNLSLRAYYQTELAPLDKNRSAFEQAGEHFLKALNRLKNLVQDQPQLLKDINNVQEIYDNFIADSKAVFDSKQRVIEVTSTLANNVDILEEKADDAATLLLDLADHELAKTKLKGAIGLGEQLETKLNNLVSSAYEFRDVRNEQTSSIIKNEMSNVLENISASVAEIISELQANEAEDIADELNESYQDISQVLTGSMFNTKQQQLTNRAMATKKLDLVEEEIKQANQILVKLAETANDTSNVTSEIVANKVSSGNTQIYIVLSISLVAAFVIAKVTLNSITLPLNRINEMFHVVASGDLSRKLDDSGKDEFAVLSRNCNLVIENLRNLIKGVISRAEQLAAAAEETSAVTAQSTSAIEEQRNQVEQAASATTQMSSTSQSVLNSAKDALTEIKHADSEAENVKGISERNRITIEQLAAEVESAAQVINKLEQDSASIGGILDVIRAVAEQTNLLALNAAIEAARAGEHGRGFAVVADEVRTLASRTQESTQEIQNMIEVLQNGAHKAVAVMETGKVKAAECVEQSEVASQALNVITHAVHEAYDRSTQISAAAEEQSLVAHEISENLESIVAIAEQTSAGSKQTADSSSEVARLSEELQLSVREFKV